MLKRNNIYIGEVEEKTSKDFTVEYDGNISYVKPLCNSCTKVLKIEPNVITLRYTAKDFPYHLTGNYTEYMTKFVEIYYTDGTQERLVFKVIEKRK